MTIDHGRSASPSGHSRAEPEEVSALRASVPNANLDRELWRSDADHYCDRVFVTEGGGIGMQAAFGRVVVKPVGEWHYLVTEVERLSAGYAAFPRDVATILSQMGDGECVLSAGDISAETGIPEKRVREIHRALKVLGLASFGPLCDVDSEAYAPRGSGYWLSGAGDDLATGLHASAIEARRAATAETGAVHESAVGAAETPNTGRGTSHG